MKTYSKTIFSGKSVPFSGISEGSGKLYRGNRVDFSMNVIYKGSITMRDGNKLSAEYNGAIHEGFYGQTRGILEGRSFWCEER